MSDNNWREEMLVFLDNIALCDWDKLTEFEKKFARLAQKPALYLIAEHYMIINNNILKAKVKVQN